MLGVVLSSFRKGFLRSMIEVLGLGLVAIVGMAIVPGSIERSAQAQSVDPAPQVHASVLRHAASLEFVAMMKRLPPEAKQTLIGAYVAFDESPTDVSAMTGCDDDGDYVVVVSDALLRLAGFVAEAAASDEIYGTNRVDDYAAFLADAASRSGPKSPVRPVPPPPGFFDRQAGPASKALARFELGRARFREIVAAIVSHELAELLQRHLVCAHPTPTHEQGDDQWTSEERESAALVAARLYTPERVLAADEAATALVLEAGFSELGSLAWLKTMDRVEHAEKEAGHPVPTYLRLHPDAEARGRLVRATADRWHLARAIEPSRSWPVTARNLVQ
jgi:hypothetical protein